MRITHLIFVLIGVISFSTSALAVDAITQTAQPLSPSIIAWTASFVSMLFSIRVAQTFLSHNSRLFMAMALFALVWALLLPYYGNAAKLELLPSFNSFLLVYIGGILYREKLINAGKTKDEVGLLDSLSLWLLPVIISPSAFLLFFPTIEIIIFPKELIYAIVCAIIAIAGFVAIGVGVKSFLSPKRAVIIIICLIIYSLLEIIFFGSDILNIISHAPPEYMPDELKILFAIVKIIFVALFVWFVGEQGMTESDSKLPFYKKIGKIIGI